MTKRSGRPQQSANMDETRDLTFSLRIPWARAFQGLGAALLVPNSLALLRTTFPDARKRARAIGIWAAVASIGALSGPLLGGVLVNAFDWRSIFLINLPIGILGFLLTSRYVAPSTPQGGRSLDLPGQVAGILALGTLIFALIEGNSLGSTSPLILAAYTASILFFLFFLFRCDRWRGPRPRVGLCMGLHVRSRQETSNVKH